MAKLFTQEKRKHIDIININDLIILFIQDDSTFPSKILSIKLDEKQTKSLINKLKYRLSKMEANNG